MRKGSDVVTTTIMHLHAETIILSAAWRARQVQKHITRAPGGTDGIYWRYVILTPTLHSGVTSFGPLDPTVVVCRSGKHVSGRQAPSLAVNVDVDSNSDISLNQTG
jgi:hypothetical protein